jgi:hypothetical protein
MVKAQADLIGDGQIEETVVSIFRERRLLHEFFTDDGMRIRKSAESCREVYGDFCEGDDC